MSYSEHTLKGDANRKVWLDGQPLDPQRSLEHRNHSPDGFNWGYGGSGPAQLALAVILELTDEETGYQNFKWDVIALIPAGPFEIRFSFDSISTSGCLFTMKGGDDNRSQVSQ